MKKIIFIIFILTTSCKSTYYEYDVQNNIADTIVVEVSTYNKYEDGFYDMSYVIAPGKIQNVFEHKPYKGIENHDDKL